MIKRLKNDLKIRGLDLVDYPGSLDKLETNEVGYETREYGVDLYMSLKNQDIVLKLLEDEVYKAQSLDHKWTCKNNVTAHE